MRTENFMLNECLEGEIYCVRHLVELCHKRDIKTISDNGKEGAEAPERKLMSFKLQWPQMKVHPEELLCKTNWC
ncbi:hypothetical protein GLYMA_13G005200v4 [Glycine max]|uniref:Uncharacterized protein n=1 Tax=Glycine max TaxID=3847 RepID=K7LYB1_SOYBN|nr:hypothetical protein GYH30_034845 [Glycine max]KRH17643.1 hypothetical protein GLYMA_13G005200v4 [Glycine max]